LTLLFYVKIPLIFLRYLLSYSGPAKVRNAEFQTTAWIRLGCRVMHKIPIEKREAL